MSNLVQNKDMEGQPTGSSNEGARSEESGGRTTTGGGGVLQMVDCNIGNLHAGPIYIIHPTGRINPESDAVYRIEGGNYFGANIGPLYVNNIYSEPPPPPPLGPDTESNAVDEFLKRVEIHLLKMLGNSITYHSQPTKMILDMEGCKDNDMGSGSTNNLFGHDLERVELEQIHDDFIDKPARHVMILGEAGAGKTTNCKIYSSTVRDKKIKALENIQLVQFVNAFDLQNHDKSTAFDLLFTQQMAGDPETELNAEVQQAGQDWLEKNSDKFLITIDGLDQSTATIGGREPRIDATTKARCDRVIANIMSGRIWGRARVLTSSRWNVYWNLEADQKPDKVLGLRGFDDDDLRRDLTLHRLERISLKLFELCRNPLFLQYTMEVLQRNANQIPDSISGLMSAVFLNFIHSIHSTSPNRPLKLDSLTKLAYQGLSDKRFYFTENYLKKCDIDPEDLKSFLSVGTNPQPGCKIPISKDMKFLFSHQIMQEYCCALHVLNLVQDDVKRFVATTLNESRMEMTRKIFYGIIMDDRNTDSMRAYLQDLPCSIAECRTILFNQLLDMIPNNTIQDIQVVTLISECGVTTIEKLKKHVKRIRIDTRDLLKSDQITLASMITQLPSSTDVYVGKFMLDPPLIQQLKNHQVKTFKAGYRILESVSVDFFDDLMQLIDKTTLEFVWLLCSDDVKRKFLQRWTQTSTIPFDNLGLLNLNDRETIQLLFDFLSKFSLRILRLNILCDVTTEELSNMNFNDDKKAKVEILVLEDKSLLSEKIAVYLKIFSRCNCNELTFSLCDMTTEKFGRLTQGCKTFDIKLGELNAIDEVMPTDAYGALPALLNTTRCKNMTFINCDLNEQKICKFGSACKTDNTELSQLKIHDRKMPVDAYGEVSTVLKVTQCKNMVFRNCDLTEEKINKFVEGCKENITKISMLFIVHEGFRATAELVTAICELMTSAVEGLDIDGWDIAENQRQILRRTLHLSSSKIQSLKLPHENCIHKGTQRKCVNASDETE